ncbi:PREDICTED: protein UNUSUAL FLORAL ORGANS [Tarenaya hassleriana]|uniref:protein UNUSUAL FLORAL ORGANS n=1 Tax=Tarenaya hassleriana TaxID=28532 RepID=UPI00053C09D8|nr:PREDICTED: protein UNUSUAL FLORAL ORGANS [Tarenaya hassleriana]
MDVFSNPSLALPFSYTFTSSSSSTTTSSDSSSGPWMDSRIWSKLPPQLLERVIAFLPPPAFFRSRCVCKRWYGLLFSNSFLEIYLQVLLSSSRRCNWFLFFKRKTLKSYIYKTGNSRGNQVDDPRNGNSAEGYLFDPYELQWYRLSFPYIPTGFYPFGSSGGLVCWVSEEAGLKTLLLSNPLVGSVSQLPPTSRPRLFPSIGLSISPTSIDVSVAGDDLISPYAVKNLSSESFHVDAGGFFSIWAITSSLPRLCSLESGKMVYVQGKFYCMNYGPYSVLSYDVAGNRWFKIQAPMRRFIRSPSLMESKGRLILVAAVEKSKLNVPKSLRLWSLQRDDATWIEIERMPQQLYVQFAAEEAGKGFECVGNGEFMMIVLRGTSSQLMFDMARKGWQWILPCPYGGSGGGGEVLQGFAYEPAIATPVASLLDQLALPF